MIKDDYRTETNKDVYAESNGRRGLEEHSTGTYSDAYVKWLESKVKNINYDTVLCPVDDIAKELGWQDYAHMILNEDNIEGYAKKAIDMLYEQNGHKKPFCGA